MNQPIRIIVTFMCFMSSWTHAQQGWHCMAFDKQASNFEATAPTLEKAMKTAKQQCQTLSAFKKTCKTAQSYCDEVEIGDHSRCLVTDDDGHAWDLHTEDACKKALAMCQQFIYLEGGAHGKCWIKHGKEEGNLNAD